MAIVAACLLALASIFFLFYQSEFFNSQTIAEFTKQVNNFADANPGDRAVVKVTGTEFAFRWCPAGAFIMGSEQNENTRNDETPLHEVKLTHGFWMLETEVTQEMYERVIGMNPSAYSKLNPSPYAESDVGQYPVENVNWHEAVEFCRCLEDLIGHKVRLPTEAEWEYACRAGTSDDYYGDVDSIAWHHDHFDFCLLYTSPSPRDQRGSRMPSSA